MGGRSSVVGLAVGLLLGAVACGLGAAATRSAHAAESPPGGKRSGFRRLAPNALTVIPPSTRSDFEVLWRHEPPENAAAQDGAAVADAEPGQVSTLELFEVTRGLAAERSWKPQRAAGNTTLVERSKALEFPRDIWCLEFAFKPLRFIEVDVPVAELRMRRKKVWYLVYRVRNTGGRRTVIEADDRSQRKTEAFDTPVRFIPHFVLESLEGVAEDDGEAAYRGYLDRVIPSALGQIRRREDPNRELFDSASMCASDIPPGGERWGVAMWEDVDPRLDFFTISIRGLTNAIHWRVKRDAAFAGDTIPASQMDHALVSLRLDFWRPGDDRDEVEEEIHVGYAGMFERLALGSRLLEAVGRPNLVKSQPAEGLAALGLTWSELAEAAASAPAGSDFVPLVTVVRKLAAVPEPTARGRIVKAVFGDLALDGFEQLSRALAGPVAPAQDAARREPLARIDLTPEKVAEKPLESLATVLETLDETPRGGPRQRLADAFFGPAAPRVRSLARELSLACTNAVLDDLEVDRRLIQPGDGLAAFAAIQEVVNSQNAPRDPGERRRLLVGLFGPRGPALFDAATRVNEGIDHSWVLRYETDVDGP